MAQETSIGAGAAPGVCAICGRPITEYSTIDHVIPQAIYKWNEQYLDAAEFSALRRRITSGRNTVRAHRWCNERKEESIIRIDSLHVSRSKRAKLRNTYHAVKPYIEAFERKKAELRAAQLGRCFVCGERLKDGGVLRRIDDAHPRTWDNACILCHRCNRRIKSKNVEEYKARRKATAELREAKGAAMQTIDQALDRLGRSRFRASFRLSQKERACLEEKGMETMRRHAEDFVRQRLAPADPANDGKQTPMHGHPVFKAMHATACCCRGCLEKWYKVPQHRPLTEEEQRRIVRLLLAWLERQRTAAAQAERAKETAVKST